MSDEIKIPKIYVYRYTDPRVNNLIKVGYTSKDDVVDRIREQFGSRADIHPPPYELLHYEDAITDSKEEFMDHDVHAKLIEEGIEKVVTTDGNTSELFITNLESIINAIKAVKKRDPSESARKLKETELSVDAVFVNDSFLNKQLLHEEKQLLCKDLNLINSYGKVYSWRGVKPMLMRFGYEVIDEIAVIDNRRRRVSTIKKLSDSSRQA